MVPILHYVVRLVFESLLWGHVGHPHCVLFGIVTGRAGVDGEVKAVFAVVLAEHLSIDTASRVILCSVKAWVMSGGVVRVVRARVVRSPSRSPTQVIKS